MHTAVMLGAARRAHVRRTVHWRGRRGRRGIGGRAGYNNYGTGEGSRHRRSYKLHRGGFSRGLTSCGGVGEGPEPAELQATQRRVLWRTGDVTRRCWWRTGAGGHRGSPLFGRKVCSA
jgi:hypothetical protein